MAEVEVKPKAKLYVKKFGGTSVGSIERIEVIADQVAKSFHNGQRQVIVLSAMAGETNRLFALGAQIDNQPYSREMDMLVSTGEQVSIALMAMALQKRGLKARSLTGDQVQVHTNSQYGRASIESVDTDYIQGLLQQETIPVVAGFQGRNSQGDVTTLGRGGSDTTAVALAAALEADECQIYTDVAGVYTTDPNIEPSAQKLDCISFEEMLEMARLGAKVLHPDSVAYAERFGVSLRVLSSFEAGSGTLIEFNRQTNSDARVAGIAVSRNQVIINLPDLEAGSDGYTQVFQNLAQIGVNVDLIAKSQSSVDNVSFTLAASDLEYVLAKLDGLTKTWPLGKIHYETNIANVSLVGDGVFAKNEVAAKVFDTLGALGIQVKLISTADIKMSVVIDEKHLHSAVRALHHAFELNKV